MNLRKSLLPPGWYPRKRDEIVSFIRGWVAPPLPGSSSAPKNPEGNDTAFRGKAVVAAAPHAGWYYSGAIAVQAAAALAETDAAAKTGAPDTVAVLGGHLPAGARPLFYLEDAAETPFGVLEIDGELRNELVSKLGGASDRFADNTVEVLLPLVHYFFPESRLLALRVPADTSAFALGKVLYDVSTALGRSIKVLASTDLTHYGANYGFSPKGSGSAALNWLKEVNDRRFIDAVIAGDGEAALHRAEEERSACSAGAVLAAMGYAAASCAADGAKTGTKGADNSDLPKAPPAALLAYGTSADVSMAEDGKIPDSFVGYGAFAWFCGK
jgi:AmmeMemoRadiSam system protein B